LRVEGAIAPPGSDSRRRSEREGPLRHPQSHTRTPCGRRGVRSGTRRGSAKKRIVKRKKTPSASSPPNLRVEG